MTQTYRQICFNKAGVSYIEYQKWLAEHRREDALREKRHVTLKGYLK